MPPVIGILFALVGAWFLYQAFQRRRYLRSLHSDSGSASSEQTPDSDAAPSNQRLQQFASGCAPVVAIGVLLLALAVAAIAFLMDGPRRISIVDILGLLFFAAAYAFSLMMRTYDNMTLMPAAQADKAPTQSADDSRAT
ncbi:hypothetical protein [Rhabdochromatium marinum]|uniref:hypothetical protein n=1 Tax=Rhabdochromatium marinum TaxID=48729 RepID=UPI001904FFF9|nr:hypothetical protein [Rhabdochromatium marinum]MBK1647859.1 hypothetical protein [Rhabdochromatium marinum]